MSSNSILEQIKNNLEWLEIDTKGKTWEDIIKELKERTKGNGSPSLPLETLMLINLLLKLEKKGSKENGK